MGSDMHTVGLLGHILAHVHHGVDQLLDVRPLAREQRRIVRGGRHVEHPRRTNLCVSRPTGPNAAWHPLSTSTDVMDDRNPTVMHRELERGEDQHVGPARPDLVAETQGESGRRA
jgi:hypothetical protein